MPWRLLSTLILPFLGYCVGFAAATVALDAALHAAGLAWVGRYLGIPGTLLTFHQWAGWAGASLVLVHAGLHFEAILPWVATAAMCINVLSGLTGKFLLSRTREDIGERRRTLVAEGRSAAEIEDRLHDDLAAMRLINHWRTVHIPIFLTFAVTALGHIFSILLFWNWR